MGKTEDIAAKKKRKRRSPGSGKIIILGALGAVIVLAIVLVVVFGTEDSPEEDVKEIMNLEDFRPLDEENPAQGIVLNDERLLLEAVGMYTGAYVEDGSDTNITDVAAIVVKNTSEDMLQIAEIELALNDSRTAEFRLTNLPAGGTALVLDMNKLTVTEGIQVTESSQASRFFDGGAAESDKLETEGVEGRLTLKNESEETYSMVYVYYKTKIDKDIYLGGITYRVPFEGIPGKTQIETDAGHYSPDKSEIVGVQILDEIAEIEENEKEE